jgi:hypothetical protein
MARVKNFFGSFLSLGALYGRCHNLAQGLGALEVVAVRLGGLMASYHAPSPAATYVTGAVFAPAVRLGLNSLPGAQGRQYSWMKGGGRQSDLRVKLMPLGNIGDEKVAIAPSTP